MVSYCKPNFSITLVKKKSLMKPHNKYKCRASDFVEYLSDNECRGSQSTFCRCSDLGLL